MCSEARWASFVLFWIVMAGKQNRCWREVIYERHVKHAGGFNAVRVSLASRNELIMYMTQAVRRWLNSGLRGFGDIRLELTSVRPVSHLLVLSFRTGPQIHAYSASWKENGEYCYHWWCGSDKCCDSIEQNNICIDAVRPWNNRRTWMNKLTARMSSTWPAS